MSHLRANKKLHKLYFRTKKGKNNFTNNFAFQCFLSKKKLDKNDQIVNIIFQQLKVYNKFSHAKNVDQIKQNYSNFPQIPGNIQNFQEKKKH